MELPALLSPTAETSHSLTWFSVLLTYGVQAGVWALVAALLAKLGSQRASSQNVIWKVAFFFPLVSLLLSLTVPEQLSFRALLFAAPSRSEGSPLVALASAAVARTLDSSRLPSWLVWPARGGRGSWLVAAAVVGACALGLVRFIASAARLWSLLRARTPVADPRLLQRFYRLHARTRTQRVRLTESSLVSGPMVLGAWEVCIPRDQLAQLSDGEVDAVFAHELAHLERCDGLWFPLVGLIEAVLWLQPLNRWVAARYRHSAELACDDRAVELTQAPLDLARALTQMAELAARWPVQRRVWDPAMAGVLGARVLRVRRLVAWSTTSPTGRAGNVHTKQRVLVLLASIVTVLLVTSRMRIDLRAEQDVVSSPRAEARPRQTGRTRCVQRRGETVGRKVRQHVKDRLRPARRTSLHNDGRGFSRSRHLPPSFRLLRRS
ncbi:MAG: hypothetical protein RLZZ450_1985 [Pseudomonadota bacterium]